MMPLFWLMRKHYESLGDGWRERSYRTTAGTVVKFQWKRDTNLGAWGYTLYAKNCLSGCCVLEYVFLPDPSD